MPIIVDYNPVGLAGTLASQAGMGDASQRNFQMNNAAADDALRRQQFEAQQQQQAYENQYRQQEADRNRQMQAAQFGETQRYHDLTTMSRLQDAAARGDRFAQEQLFKYQQEDRRANEFADRQNNADIAAFSKQTDADIKANHADYLAQMKRIDSEVAKTKAREDARNAWDSLTSARGKNLDADQMDALYQLAQTGTKADVMREGNRWADKDQQQMNADRTAEALAPDRARRGNQPPPKNDDQRIAFELRKQQAIDELRSLKDYETELRGVRPSGAITALTGQTYNPAYKAQQIQDALSVLENRKRQLLGGAADQFGQPAPQAAPQIPQAPPGKVPVMIDPATKKSYYLIDGQLVPAQ